MESVENYCQIYINTQYVIGKWKAIPEEKKRYLAECTL